MSSMIIWVLGIGVSTALLLLIAAKLNFWAHMTIAALVAILVALSAFVESRATLHGGKADIGRQASSNLRHMGLVWTWAALATVVTYSFNILQWREWWHFFLAMLAFAGLSLFLSATLQKDADAKTEDDTMFKIARGYAIATLVAAPLVMLGLLQQGKMWRFFTEAGQRPGSQDWAASNIYFFGALALAAIAYNAVVGLRQAKR